MRVMAVGAHPDDVELSCGGLIAKLASMGYEVGIVDLTCGELGSSGDEKTRLVESRKAARVLGASWRECCGLPDAGLDHSDREQTRTVVELVRRHEPSVVLAPYRCSRHPDHMEASEMIRRSLFLAGLRRLAASGKPYRSARVLYYMGDAQFEPTLIVDIGRFFKKKMKAIGAYQSQFDRNRPGSYPTRLNEAGFLELIETRARHLGSIIGVSYAEGFLYEGPLQIDDPVALLARV